MRIRKLFNLFTLLILVWIVYTVIFYLLVPRIPAKRRISSNEHHPIDELQIKLINIDGIYLDGDKSAVFYFGENKLIITLLVPRFKIIPRYGLEVIIRKNNQIIYTNRTKNLELVSANSYYKFSTILINEILLEQVSDKLTFQINTNHTINQEFPINVVNLRKDVNKKAARLIKCSWLPQNRDHIEFIIKLIIECKYDSIYICVFKQDNEFKSLLNRFNHIKKIKIIEFESVPNFMPGEKEFTSHEEISTDENIVRKKGEILDPVLEFLLNQIYPFLIEKYQYIHAGDFDHLIFTSNNNTFYQEIRHISERNNVPENASVSLYFNQYWALENNMSREIFQYVVNHFKFNISSEEVVKSVRKYPVYVKVKSLNLELEVDSDNELLYAVKIAKYLHNSISEPMFRYVIYKFKHRHVYGQMVHDTRSSLLIKLCTAGEYTSQGAEVVIKSPHSIHYRDLYNFRVLKPKNGYIPIKNFILWSDYQLTEM